MEIDEDQVFQMKDNTFIDFTEQADYDFYETVHRISEKYSLEILTEKNENKQKLRIAEILQAFSSNNEINPIKKRNMKQAQEVLSTIYRKQSFDESDLSSVENKLLIIVEYEIVRKLLEENLSDLRKFQDTEEWSAKYIDLLFRKHDKTLMDFLSANESIIRVHHPYLMEEKFDMEGVEQFKIRRLIRKLSETHGNGTSIISLIIPAKQNIAQSRKHIEGEMGNAAHIRDRLNRQSVQEAMVSTLAKLKQYSQTPNNGLVIFCGVIFGEDGKTEKKINIDFEPYRPINVSRYICDSVFHVQWLSGLLDNQQPFGFIIIDGNGTLFGQLHSDSKQILASFSVQLPKKVRKGGHSAGRFARIRTEKRNFYLRKAAEMAVQSFIDNDNVSVQGLVLAGCGDFKTDLANSTILDDRLQKKIIKIVDVGYGGENGFNQAIQQSQDCLSNVKFVQEKNLISKFFLEIAADSGKFVYGIDETMQALLGGSLDLVICFQYLEWTVIRMKHRTNQCYEIIEALNIAEWLAENFQSLCNSLHFISDQSNECNQFIKSFSGLGGILRFQLERKHLSVKTEEWKCDDDEFV